MRCFSCNCSSLVLKGQVIRWTDEEHNDEGIELHLRIGMVGLRWTPEHSQIRNAA